MTGTPPSQWKTGKESAAYLGVSLPHWYRVVAPQIRGYRVGRKLRYRVEDIDAWLEKQLVEPAKPAA